MRRAPSRLAYEIGVVLFLALFGVGQAQGGTGTASPDQCASTNGTLTIATAKDVVSLDPGRANDLASMNVYEQIFDTLVTYNKNLDLVPSVAESWSSNADATVWTFHIRKGIKFQNGSPLTATDVAFSFQRILDSPAAASQKKSKISMINEIKVLDPYTVEFDLKFPYGPFLGAARQQIVPKALIQSEGEQAFAQHPVGSGPFKFVEWVPDDHVTLVRNDGYWLKTPCLARVIFKPIPDSTVAGMSAISGNVDAVEAITPQMLDRVKSAGVNIETAEGMNYYWVGFRQYGKPYTDVRFRKMVYYSIDMNKAIANIFPSGTGSRAYGPVPPGLWPRDLTQLKAMALPQDTAKAKELFSQLVADGVMTKDTPILIRVNQDPIREKLGTILVTDLQAIGVNAKLQVMEWSAYLNWVLHTQDPGIYMLGTVPAIPDPDAVFNWLFSSQSTQGGTILGLKKSQADDWIQQARQITDRAQRTALYNKVVDWALGQEVYHIPAYHENVVWAVNKRVHGLIASPTGEWWLVTPFANVSVSSN